MRCRVLATFSSFTLLFVCMMFLGLGEERTVTVSAAEKPDAVCAGCHRAIYDRYEATAKARGSGAAVNAVEPGKFLHQASGVEYRVFLREGSAWMSFNRSGGELTALHGERKLEYFVGSGRRGRTYLYQEGGEWFELPVNYYTHRKGWDMAPAYENVASMPGVLPTNPNCLHCHASQVEPSLPTAANRFASAPFLQSGIGCSACHGDPTSHLAQGGRGPIINPSKLSPAKRDSTCIQCHLEGDAVVYQAGRSLSTFRVGDDLADTAVYFVRSSQQSGGSRATSQYEALLRSACKRASGDRLTCTTCHDPHGSPSEPDRVQFFRTRCLACHSSPRIASSHHPEEPDCAQCHMPRRNTSDISHEQVSDHDIEARPALPRPTARVASEDLIPVGLSKAADREFGLAYAQRANHGERASQERALRLLEKAAKKGVGDVDFLVELGFQRQVARDDAGARVAYEKALAQNEYEPTALANLAVLEASAGKVKEAVHLLDRLVVADPSRTSAGLNLAFIVCRLGHSTEALALIKNLQAFNPDDPALRTFLFQGDYAGQHCQVQPARM